jgi:hypothetical protein
VPDENSNLKSPAPSGRPSANRRRGRRGGRGRGRTPRAPGEKSTEEISSAPENATEAAETAEAHDQPEAEEVENTGGFRTPHAEAPADFASHPEEPVDAPAAESVSENFVEPPPVAEQRPAPLRPREFPQREQRESREPREPREAREPREPREQRAPQPRPQVPPAQRQWVKPADFRPAESTAIHEAVAHATFIANALKELHDQMDEILELVEVAERQKLADERELDELRRALRRIQPQSRPAPSPQQFQRSQPRRDEPRQPRPDSRENVQRHEEPARSPEAEEPPAPTTE